MNTYPRLTGRSPQERLPPARVANARNFRVHAPRWQLGNQRG